MMIFFSQQKDVVDFLFKIALYFFFNIIILHSRDFLQSFRFYILLLISIFTMHIKI